MDDDTDLVQAARRSFVEAVHEVTPGASFPIHLDLRLSGPSTEGGRLPASVLPIAERFQNEIREALSGAAARIADIDWVGVSEGSAVMHMVPRFVAAPADDQFDTAVADEFEAALGHVLKVHNLLEAEADDSAFANERPDFLHELRLLTNELTNSNLDLEVIATGSQGARRRSTLSRTGRIRARQLFEKAKVPPTKQVFSGNVVNVDLESQTIQLRVSDKRARVAITDVPPNVLTDGTILVGHPVSIAVVTEHQADRTGNQSADKHHWDGIAGDPMPT
ncbi:hypothetical protein [Mycolicibacterium fortuitum]|uniref:hypothetical protein n=1 Tax=Mycolicibacterium fortuitum TaxID=1766 RepID=UPI001AF0160B|nr:hypothetical protein [Mycolicibacterium fortuitum]MBP3083719.1 hypothetical protein [Mycolicibacterium fortuitum]